MDERNDIHRCSNEGLSLRAIARRLNRPTSAVTREVARNTVVGGDENPRKSGAMT
jgi:IS30 family transposase